jgi:diguanylate cyclase (GGDEF)-like protein
MYASRDLGVRVMADAKGVPWISQLLARETAGDGSMPMGAKEPRRILYAHAATTEGWHVLVIRPQLSLGHIMGKFIAGAVPLLLLTLCVAIVIAHHLIAMLSRPLELLMKRIDTFDIDATEGHFRGFGELPSEYVAMMRRLHRMAWRLRAWHARLRAALADAKRARTEVISVLVNREDEVRARTRELAEANAALERLSRIDPLTEVANRRCFAEALEREWRAALRDSCALSVFLIDIDHYKAFNDRYGHQAGDDCLRQVAGALRLALFRPRDHLARYGGEEFAVIAAQLDVAGAALVGERIRTAVRALGVRHEASGPSGLLTVSIGAATVIPDPARSPEWLLRIADRALYAAKAAGRDRVAQAEADERLVVNEPEQVHVVSLSATG